MWCVGQITEEYRQRMYALLELYARPYDPRAPVICVDEKSKQLLEQTRPALPAKPGAVAKEDYEYARAGTCNIFVAVEPKGGRRHTAVTVRRAKPDFVAFICELLDTVYAGVEKIHLVVDNLNTHFARCFEEVLGPQAAALILARLEFHYTPKHASWLNMAELEIGVMERQCTGRRLASSAIVATELAAWQLRRNKAGQTIEWTFTRTDADRKLSRHYVA